MTEIAPPPPGRSEMMASRGLPLPAVWATTLLALIALLASMHRNALAILLVPIQQELGVGDAAMGALSGTAFSVVYALGALPVAHLADRTNRRNVIAAAVAIWSAATILSGMAATYALLLLGRAGVAGAQAAQPPATFSLLADLFSARRRGAAVSIVVAGLALGYAVGSLATGYLNDSYGWRVALMVLGAPGLLVALVFQFTVREPPRAREKEAATAGPVDFLQALAGCLRIRTVWPLAIGAMLLNVAYGAYLTWTPAFLLRVHGLTTTQMGALFGLVPVFGAASTVIGGLVTDWLAVRGARWRLAYAAATAVLSAPLLVVGLLAPSLTGTIAAMAGYSLICGGLTGVCTTAFLEISPPARRGVMIAVMNISGTMLGGGLGPPLVGWAADMLKPSLHGEALRYALLLAPLFLLLAGLMFHLASRSMDADVAKASA